MNSLRRKRNCKRKSKHHRTEIIIKLSKKMGIKKRKNRLWRSVLKMRKAMVYKGLLMSFQQMKIRILYQMLTKIF